MTVTAGRGGGDQPGDRQHLGRPLVGPGAVTDEEQPLPGHRRRGARLAPGCLLGRSSRGCGQPEAHRQGCPQEEVPAEGGDPEPPQEVGRHLERTRTGAAGRRRGPTARRRRARPRRAVHLRASPGPGAGSQRAARPAPRPARPGSRWVGGLDESAYGERPGQDGAGPHGVAEGVGRGGAAQGQGGHQRGRRSRGGRRRCRSPSARYGRRAWSFGSEAWWLSSRAMARSMTGSAVKRARPGLRRRPPGRTGGVGPADLHGGARHRPGHRPRGEPPRRPRGERGRSNPRSSPVRSRRASAASPPTARRRRLRRPLRRSPSSPSGAARTARPRPAPTAPSATPSWPGPSWPVRSPSCRSSSTRRNPPGVGDPSTLAERQWKYLALIFLSLVVLAGAARLSSRLRERVARHRTAHRRRARHRRAARGRLRPAAPVLRRRRCAGQPPVALPDRLPRREPPPVDPPHGHLRGGGRPAGAGPDRPGRAAGAVRRRRRRDGDPATGVVPPLEGVLLVGHGSRSDEGAAEMLAIARLVGPRFPP